MYDLVARLCHFVEEFMSDSFCLQILFEPAIIRAQYLQLPITCFLHHGFPLQKTREHLCLKKYTHTYLVLSSTNVKKYSAPPIDLALTLPHTTSPRGSLARVPPPTGKGLLWCFLTTHDSQKPISLDLSKLKPSTRPSTANCLKLPILK